MKFEPYFNNSLVTMGAWSRTLARIVSGIAWAVMFMATLAFLGSDIGPVFWTGILFALYLADRFFHRGAAERSIARLPAEGRVNVADYLSPASTRYIVSAHDRTLVAKGGFFLNLAAFLLDDRGVKEAIRRLDVDPDEFKEKLKDYLERSEATDDSGAIAEKIERLAAAALRQAVRDSDASIDPPDLFAAVVMEDPAFLRLFDLFDIDPADVDKALIFGRFSKSGLLARIPRFMGGFTKKSRRNRIMNRAWTSKPTPTLDRFSVDLTERARRGEVGLLIGHDAEYERLLNVTSQPVKPNALLVGDPGFGMDKVIAHLAYMITKDKVPPQLFDKRLISLNIGELLAGAEGAKLQERLQTVFAEIFSAGNIILAIPEIHNLARTAGAKEINAANSIMPIITSNDFPLIGTSYPREFKQYIESDSAFSEAFEVIRFKEVSSEEATRILIYQSLILEEQYGVKISYGAVKKAVELASRYFRQTPLPGSASDLIKEALAAASRSRKKVIAGDDIIATAETRINIPIKGAKGEEAEKLLNMEDLIHKKLVDQEAAVAAVSQALREYRSGLSRKGGPIGTFLFVGPTGVGKTELSKILAKLQFGSEDAMIRFDMSEYQDKQSFFQFVGSPDGSVSGLLTDRVLEKPYSLILLDEFEKAYPDILNLFLQVFDDGRLTDNLGRVVSFENTIIIATSNAHSDFVKAQIEAGKPMDEISAELKKKLVSVFRPELLNRFSRVVVFRNLRPEDIEKITGFNLQSLVNSLRDEQGIYLSITPEASRKIAELGYDPVFGARPLRQVISEKIKDPLSKVILSGKAGRGSTVEVKLQDGQFVLE